MNRDVLSEQEKAGLAKSELIMNHVSVAAGTAGIALYAVVD